MQLQAIALKRRGGGRQPGASQQAARGGRGKEGLESISCPHLNPRHIIDTVEGGILMMFYASKGYFKKHIN